uniref:Netrin G1 n=1 Tax=Pavo cristatus TaxID=9049 RepID=A0A8C9EKL6_PAVCR
MYLSRFLSLHALWVTVSSVMQHYPSVWGHYDVCKTQIYTEEGKVWDYMACQPEARDMIKYVRVTLDPPDITCGDPPETFCAMGNPYMCNNECDASTQELAHPPELMFDLEGRHPSTFWQSTTWKDYPKPLHVNITLSWNKTIELTDNIVITFESGRPDQMILEKSLDYGRTWQPYQYYATDCLDAFHMDPKSVRDLSQHTVLEIICTEEYSTGYMTNSKIIHFEIKDRFAFFAGPRLHNMASLYGQLDTTKKLRDFFTITDLRIRLLRPATGEIYVDEQHLARYFYAISDIRVYGRGFCECKEGASGPKCDKCLPGYIWHGLGCQPNVCDNELLHCQNGGTCINNVRCQCPPAYTGILCEKLKCERDPGGCSQSSAQGAISHGPLLLLMALLGAAGLHKC